MIKKLTAVLFAFAMILSSMPSLAQDLVDFDGKSKAGQTLEWPKALNVARAISPETAAPPAEWTIMVYLNAKNNLEPYGFLNFNQMEMVGSSSNLKVVVEFGLRNSSTAGWHGSHRYLVEKDSDPKTMHSPVLQSIAQADMGDWKHLVEFGKWAKAQYPAKHYMLIVWNHGSGWVKKQLSTRGISYDDDTDHHISTPELGQALAAIGGIDVYASDACLMQMAEVAYEIKDSATTIIGSEETEPGDGYTYNTFLEPLSKNPAQSAEDIGRIVVKSYVDHYKPSGAATQSALRAGTLKDLAPLLDAWTASVMKTNEPQLIKTAMDQVQKFFFADNIDLVDFLRLVSAGTKNPDVKTKSEQVTKYIQDTMLISNDTVGSGYKMAKGLAIYLPSSGLSSNYASLSWAKNSSWQKFAQWVVDIESKYPASIPPASQAQNVPAGYRN